jgi:hypothetical protein
MPENFRVRSAQGLAFKFTLGVSLEKGVDGHGSKILEDAEGKARAV